MGEMMRQNEKGLDQTDRQYRYQHNGNYFEYFPYVPAQKSKRGKNRDRSQKRREHAGNDFPGAVYRLLSTDAGQQFSELLTVLELEEAVDAGGSRDRWKDYAVTLLDCQDGPTLPPLGTGSAPNAFL